VYNRISVESQRKNRLNSPVYKIFWNKKAKLWFQQCINQKISLLSIIVSCMTSLLDSVRTWFDMVCSFDFKWTSMTYMTTWEMIARMELKLMAVIKTFWMKILNFSTFTNIYNLSNFSSFWRRCRCITCIKLNFKFSFDIF